MPFLILKMTPGATDEQKAKLIKDLSQVVVDVMGKDPQSMRVLIEEIPAENWGIAGETLAARRKRGA